jgi:hypothetical protein
MSYKNTIDAIYSSLTEIQNLLLQFEEKDELPRIEIDLAMSKLRNVYDLLLLLKDEATGDTAEIESTKEDRQIEPYEPRNIEKTEEPQPPRTSLHMSQGEKAKTVSDNYKSETGSLNDSFSGNKSDQDLMAHLKSKPIGNLSSAIGINDKYEFIRELFSGNATLYENTLLELDDCKNFNDAYNYLIQNFNWNMDHEAVQRILELIRRKFITINK